MKLFYEINSLTSNFLRHYLVLSQDYLFNYIIQSTPVNARRHSSLDANINFKFQHPQDNNDLLDSSILTRIHSAKKVQKSNKSILPSKVEKFSPPSKIIVTPNKSKISKKSTLSNLSPALFSPQKPILTSQEFNLNFAKSPLPLEKKNGSHSLARKLSEINIKTDPNFPFGRYFNKELERTKKKWKVKNEVMDEIFDSLLAVKNKSKQ